MHDTNPAPWSVQSRQDERTTWHTIGHLFTEKLCSKVIEKMSYEDTPERLQGRPYDVRVVNRFGKMEYFSRGAGRKLAGVRHGK